MNNNARPHRWWLTAILAVAAAAAPIAAAAVVKGIGASAERYEILSVGTLAALIVGTCAGMQRGGLWAFLSGPAVGFIVGLLDLRVFTWLYGWADLPISVAAVFPTWGLLFGAWLALHRRSRAARIAVVLIAAGVDLAARLAWLGAASFELINEVGTWRWLVESLTYSPTAFCIVLLMPAIDRRAKQA